MSVLQRCPLRESRLYHYSNFFFYKINKGDLPLMYASVFRFEFIDFVVFFFSAVIACLTLVITSLNEESDRGQTITAKKTE